MDKSYSVHTYCSPFNSRKISACAGMFESKILHAWYYAVMIYQKHVPKCFDLFVVQSSIDYFHGLKTRLFCFDWSLSL